MTRFSAVFYLTALLAVFCTGSAKAQEKRYSLGAQMCRGLFLVPVTLNRDDGRTPDERTLWFIYETGASASYVDPDSIERVSGIKVDAARRANIKDA